MSHREPLSLTIGGEAHARHRHQIAIAIDGSASGDHGSTLVLIQRYADGTVRMVKSCTAGYGDILPDTLYSLASDGTIVPTEGLDKYESRLRAEAREADYQAEKNA